MKIIHIIDNPNWAMLSFVQTTSDWQPDKYRVWAK